MPVHDLRAIEPVHNFNQDRLALGQPNQLPRNLSAVRRGAHFLLRPELPLDLCNLDPVIRSARTRAGERGLDHHPQRCN